MRSRMELSWYDVFWEIRSDIALPELDPADLLLLELREEEDVPEEPEAAREEPEPPGEELGSVWGYTR